MDERGHWAEGRGDDLEHALLSGLSAAAFYWPETGRLEAVGTFPSQPSLADRGAADGVGALELRQTDDGGARLSGRFPYNTAAELGPERRETITSRAFGARIEAGEDIHLLLGHDYNRPLASTRAGSLRLDHGADALTFEATLTPDMAGSTTGRDALAMVRGRLATGISPGFIVPRGGDEVRADAGGLLRVVRSAELHELSVVVRPAYQHAQVEARSWALADVITSPPRTQQLRRRWRAWTLQPIAETIAEEATAKLGTAVEIDVHRPLQSFDAGGSARAVAGLVQAMAQAKEAGLSEATVAAAFGALDWTEAKG